MLGGGQGMGLESRPENGFLSPRSRCQVQRRRPREGGGFHVVGIPAPRTTWVTPWFKQYIREQWSQFTLYGDDLIAISLPSPNPSSPTSPACLPRLLTFTKNTAPITRSAINGECRPLPPPTRSSRRTWSRVFPSLSAGWTTGGPPTRNSTVTVSTRTVSAIRW